VNLSAATVLQGAVVNFFYPDTPSDASEGLDSIRVLLGSITILNGATTGTLTIASGNGEDVYQDASELTATITGTAGGNFENLVRSEERRVGKEYDTMSAATVNMSDSTGLEGAVAKCVFTA